MKNHILVAVSLLVVLVGELPSPQFTTTATAISDHSCSGVPPGKVLIVTDIFGSNVNLHIVGYLVDE